MRPPRLWALITDPSESQDINDPIEADEPMLNIEPAELTEPMLSADPTAPSEPVAPPPPPDPDGGDRSEVTS
mgnify:CR=1 FL=1